MDPVLLARIQFAVTAGFHYIFPPITIGMAMLIVIFQAIYLKTNDQLYDKISQFWIKIFAINFAVGVATGIVMEFEFGTNWEKYSRFVGDIFGAPLAAEGVFAFFLESTFLGILLFGRKKISKVAYFVSACMIMLGSMLSSFWIIVANSWQQTPAGYAIVNGRAELTNFFDAVFNPSTLYRFGHAIIGGWIAGAFLIAGISAYFLLKKQHTTFALKSIKVALVVALITSILQVEMGHLHAVQVTKTQPEKMATLEALFETRRNAPLVIWGFPDEEEKTIDFEISVPSLLSFMVGFNTNTEIKGLNEFAKEDLPPLKIPFYTYRIMVGFGFYFVFLALVGLVLYRKKALEKTRLFLLLMVVSIPFPVISNIMGWFAAEFGRQPWIVYRELRTVDGVSTVVSSGEILFTIILFSALYTALLALYLFLIAKKVKQGPEVASHGY